MLDAEKILLALPYGIALFGEDMKLLYMNNAMKEITGRKPGKTHKNLPIDELFKDKPDISKMVRQFAESGITYTDHEMPLLIKGVQHFAEVSVSGIAPERGILLSIKLAEGKRELQEEMERGNKVSMLSMMAAGLAHEIKNPLGGIRGAAQLMGQAGGEAKEYSTVIINEVDRINGLVNDLLSPGGEKSDNTKMVNIHELLDGTIKLMQPMMMEKGVKPKRDYDPSLPQIEMEPNRIKQVLINLIKNGLEMMNGGELKIKTRTLLDPTPNRRPGKRSRMMSIDIIDSGSGIDESVAENLFTPFNTSKQEGTGLGLVISLKIVREHGGMLTLKNRTDGYRGAVARMTLPMGKRD